MGPSWGLLWQSCCGMALAVCLGYMPASLPFLGLSFTSVQWVWPSENSYQLLHCPDVQSGVSPLPLGQVLCARSPSECLLNMRLSCLVGL